MRIYQTLKRQVLHPAKQASRWASRPLRDRLTNRRHAAHPERIALVRHRTHITSYYHSLLEWMASELPEVRPYFELHTLPCRGLNWSRCRLVVPWISENQASRCDRTRRQFRMLEAECRERSIPLINPLNSILKAIKLEASRRIREAGIRTPRMSPIRNITRFRQDAAGLSFPFLIRENRSHGGATPSYLVRHLNDLARIPLERFEDAIASEFISVVSPGDGQYRKYRYLASGDLGVPVSLHIARDWEVRGAKREMTEQTRLEEMEYQRSADPNHARFQRARRALGLDCVAFDYSYTPEAELVVWEINVLPGLGLATQADRQYINYGLRRAMAALTRHYLDVAGIPVPESVHTILRDGMAPAARGERAA